MIRMIGGETLLARGTVREHTVLSGGLHTDEKFVSERVLRNRRQIKRVADSFGQLIGKEFVNCNTILTVGSGANCLSVPVAKSLSQIRQEPVESLTTHKIRDEQGKTRKFYVSQGNIYLRKDPAPQVVIVDDVYTEGNNSGMVADLATHWGAHVLGIAVILNRNQHSRDEYVCENGETLPVRALVNLPIPVWPAEECQNQTCQA